MIEHISYSSFILFLHNRAAWHSKYVLGIRDIETNPAALTGVAFHKWAEMTLKGHSNDIALESARAIVTNTAGVNWGKTGSQEKCLKELDNLIDAYNNTLKDLGEVLHVELSVFAKVPGIKLPIKGFIDVVTKKEDGLHIIDWKTTKTLEDAPKPVHIVQAMIYKWSIKSLYKVNPLTMTFWQIKASKNKDGSPQMVPLVIVFDEYKDEEKAVKELLKSSIKEMLKKKQSLLPNLRDEYEGDKEWERYLAQIKQL